VALTSNATGGGVRFVDGRLTLAPEPHPEILGTRQPLPREGPIFDSSIGEGSGG